MTRGWLFDLYPGRAEMILWFCGPAGERWRLRAAFPYRLYAAGPLGKLRLLALTLRQKRWLRAARWTEKRDFWSGTARAVLELELVSYQVRPRLLAYLGALAEDFTFYNCDLEPAAYFLYDRGLYPCAWYELEAEEDRLQAWQPLEGAFAEELTLPPLRTLELTLTRDYLLPLGAGNGLAVTWEGQTLELAVSDPAALLQELAAVWRRVDPDLLLSSWGDEHLLPRLWQWGPPGRSPVPWDREPQPPRRRQLTGRSYFSYGRIVYQGAAALLYGRWHVDRCNSFFYREAGLPGLVQLARIGQLPLPQVARASPGTLITSMQLARAVAAGILVPWRKGEPEQFKTAAQLLTADKGGLVFQPPVGYFEQVAELDFASMYPSIMAHHNLSPETINCRCCSEPRVPENGYTICQRRQGLIPRTLRPILELRTRLKARAKTAAAPEAAAIYQARQLALKWILVTCFGYLGYKNARFGRIEAHEAVTAFGRDKLLTAKEICEAAGFTVLHGLTDCLWLWRPGWVKGGQGLLAELQELCDRITASTGVTLALEGIYRWLIFLPSVQVEERAVANRYFGVFEDGTLKYRGLLCRRRDTPPLIRRAQEELLARLARAADRREVLEDWSELTEIVAAYRERLATGRVTAAELVVTKVLSRPVAQFQVETHTCLAARQLLAAGIEVKPGEKIRYVVRDRHGPPASRVLAAPFLETLDRYDTAYYLEWLAKAAAEVLEPWRRDASNPELLPAPRFSAPELQPAPNLLRWGDS